MKKLLALAFLLCLPVAVAAIAGGPEAAQEGPSAAALTEIPPDLLPVYMAAATTCPGLPWQVLAAIGWTESQHGQGRVDPTNGDTNPPILGPPLDGSPGFAAMPDPTDPTGWTRAVGPMQFLPSTFERWAVVAPDRPPSAVPDPNNAWDAIYSGANYLCAGQAELDEIDAAILRYNRSDAYVATVLAKAEDYGLGSGQGADAQLAAGSGEAVVAAALTQLGVPYAWGDETPGVGFDCSGLVQWAFSQIGVAVPRTTAELVTIGISVTIDDLRPGDLVFTRSVRSGGQVVDRGHVAIYAGGDQVVVAPRISDVISLRPLRPEAVQAVRRVVE